MAQKLFKAFVIKRDQSNHIGLVVKCSKGVVIPPKMPLSWKSIHCTHVKILHGNKMTNTSQLSPCK